MPDPLLAPLPIPGPFMPDGINSTGISEDEFNGGGILYDPTWPLLFDSFEGLPPVVLTADKTAAFDDACSDITIRPQNDIVTIKPVPELIVIGRRR